ncbi:MAG: carboxypeptidase-like regulatory domain-containing protein [Acidobacteriaceae bacterium]
MRLFRLSHLPVALTLALVAGIIFTPATARAQDSSSMTGLVTDATGAIVPDATVTLTNKATGTSYTQTTNKQGVYHFANVSPAEGYVATFSHVGFASVQVSELSLSVGITRTLDEKLQAGTTVQVEVSAGNQQVTLNTTDASIGNNINVQELNELPVYDRTGGIVTLFYQQPGVDSGMGSVTGARTDQSEVTVDGLDVNDIASNATLAIVGHAPVDSVQQFTGTVAGLTSGIGTGSGGQFQLVTKSGTNRFHGNINEYHRDTTTVANTYFNNLVGLPRTPLIQNQFGGNIGGPIKRDKLFFFFDLSDSRIVSSSSAERTVPLSNLTGATPTLNYINDGAGCDDSSRINTQPTCISSLSAAQVAALDPNGIGFNSNVFSFIDGRYPAANDLTQGDGVNTGGYRFTYPTPNNDTTYVARVDYNITPKQKIYGRFTITRQNSTESLPVFPKDPPTHPYIDRSYGYVVSDVWTIGQNKVNQFYYGDNISKVSFPNSYNPTGINAYSFSGLDGPYSGTDGQKRRVPVPVVRDDFNWQVGNHSLTMGGTFKFIKTDSNLINNFYFVGLGQAGSALQGGLDPSLRPDNIFTDSNATALNDYDAIFPDTLGNIGDISANFNYGKGGSALPMAGGGPRAYRYFETEAYFGDTWKLTNKLTLSYGLRYQLYSVPYEAHGQESVETLTGTSGSLASQVDHSTLNAYIADRQAQSAAGDTTETGLPLYTVILGGKANKGPNFYNMAKKDFAPRVAFAYNVQHGTVINGSAGIVYDRTVINAINFLQDQISYLFSNSVTNEFPTTSEPTTDTQSPAAYALAQDTRVGSGLSYPTSLQPVPQALSVPYVPYVDGDGNLFGAAEGETNFVISPNLHDPYSIALNAGIQQDLPFHMVMKLNYVGRLGRRLLADADAGQVLDVPDYTGQSTQTMAQAFAALTTQLRAGVAVGSLTPQPWFEDVLGNYKHYFGNNTNLVADLVGQLANRGDISDTLYDLSYYSYYGGLPGLLPTNIGIPSQFGSDTYLTNLGNSNYHGLLLTVAKNMSNGLRFNVNYTWSHSIDNTSLSGANNALYNNFGMICDVTKPRQCRASSDFDVRQEITSNFNYELPFGHGKQFLAGIPFLANEAIGGWSISGIPIYRTGQATTAYSDAYLASFDNDDPAIFTGDKGDLKSKVNVSNGTVFNFAGGQAGANKVLAEFRGPIGLEYGQRNILKGPGNFFFDAGVAKTFPIFREVNLLFRADAYNVFNHPAFGGPAVNIVGNSSQFGQISSTDNEPGAGYGSRVAQFSLRLEF